jgi:HPt (histidine-containing phosphotransfer) domain-containing protein
LKGSSKNVGAEQIAALSFELEKLGREGQTEPARELLSALEAAFNRFCDVLETELRGGE